MARRLEDVGEGPEDFFIPPERLARARAEVEAYRRGELKTVDLEELEPLFDAWIADCKRLAREQGESDDA